MSQGSPSEGPFLRADMPPPTSSSRLCGLTSGPLTDLSRIASLAGGAQTHLASRELSSLTQNQ